MKCSVNVIGICYEVVWKPLLTTGLPCQSLIRIELFNVDQNYTSIFILRLSVLLFPAHEQSLVNLLCMNTKPSEYTNVINPYPIKKLIRSCFGITHSNN